MTVENGADPAANDTADSAVSNAAKGRADDEGRDDSADDGELHDDGADGQADDEEEELDLDGEKFRIPRKVREAIAKPFQQDYSRKTEEVAQGRKALDTDRETFTKEREARQAHFKDAAKVVALDDRIAEVDADLQKYTNFDWNAYRQQDPDLYEQHRINRDALRDRKDALKEQRSTAARAWTQKEQEYVSNANREYGERKAKAQAELPKLIKDWSPELDEKLTQYGNSLGFSNEDLAETTIRNPAFAREMNRLRLYDEAAKKQKTQQTFQASQEAKPVTRVGGNGGSAARKTTDSSGDALSTEEWAKRERERTAPKRAQR